MNTRVVYLLHFNRAYKHAQHYIGGTTNLKRRLAAHAAGQGARLLEVIRSAGIGFEVVRTWQGGRTLERQLKRQHHAPRWCPLCRHSH